MPFFYISRVTNLTTPRPPLSGLQGVLEHQAMNCFGTYTIENRNNIHTSTLRKGLHKEHT
jgi:hypothetical protein